VHNLLKITPAVPASPQAETAGVSSTSERRAS
jgi:hypothetical protein